MGPLLKFSGNSDLFFFITLFSIVEKNDIANKNKQYKEIAKEMFWLRNKYSINFILIHKSRKADSLNACKISFTKKFLYITEV